MKAITIWQPYAGAIAIGLKHYETRGWKTNYRGKIAIHASVKKPTREFRLLADKYGIDVSKIGEIVAVADLVDCIEMTDEFIASQSSVEKELGDWRVGRYAWKLDNMTIPDKSIKINGKQGLWTWDED